MFGLVGVVLLVLLQLLKFLRIGHHFLDPFTLAFLLLFTHSFSIYRQQALRDLLAWSRSLPSVTTRPDLCFVLLYIQWL